MPGPPAGEGPSPPCRSLWIYSIVPASPSPRALLSPRASAGKEGTRATGAHLPVRPDKDKIGARRRLCTSRASSPSSEGCSLCWTIFQNWRRSTYPEKQSVHREGAASPSSCSGVIVLWRCILPRESPSCSLFPQQAE